MKLKPSIGRRRGHAGILLIECLVYMAVFALITAGALTVFYYCWDNSKAMIYATDDLAAALRAGEGWRADVRAATGTISVHGGTAGEEVDIPEGQKTIIYHFANGEMRREGSTAINQLLLARVETSQMASDVRGGVLAWRWHVQLTPHNRHIRLPLAFTFEAVSPALP